MRPFLITILGLILALWLSTARWIFGIGGWVTLWYLPTLGLVYFVSNVYLSNRVSRTSKIGRKPSRATKITAITSWVLAFITGFLIPDMHNGSLTSIASHFTGSDTALEMAIALSNTVGIISLIFLGTAIGFAMADSRTKKSYVEENPTGPIKMVKHPLA